VLGDISQIVADYTITRVDSDHGSFRSNYRSFDKASFFVGIPRFIVYDETCN